MPANRRHMQSISMSRRSCLRPVVDDLRPALPVRERQHDVRHRAARLFRLPHRHTMQKENLIRHGNLVANVA